MERAFETLAVFYTRDALSVWEEPGQTNVSSSGNVSCSSSSMNTFTRWMLYWARRTVVNTPWETRWAARAISCNVHVFIVNELRARRIITRTNVPDGNAFVITRPFIITALKNSQQACYSCYTRLGSRIWLVLPMLYGSNRNIACANTRFYNIGWESSILKDPGENSRNRTKTSWAKVYKASKKTRWAFTLFGPVLEGLAVLIPDFRLATKIFLWPISEELNLEISSALWTDISETFLEVISPLSVQHKYNNWWR